MKQDNEYGSKKKIFDLLFSKNWISSQGHCLVQLRVVLFDPLLPKYARISTQFRYVAKERKWFQNNWFFDQTFSKNWIFSLVSLLIQLKVVLFDSLLPKYAENSSSISIWDKKRRWFQKKLIFGSTFSRN